MTEATTKRGTGWVVFAGIMLVLGGAHMFINGLWALNATTAVADSFHGKLLFSDTNLDTWGWIYIVVGLVVLVAGLCVFSRMTWARFVGVIAATVQALFAFFWLFTPYWPGALIVIAIDLLVLHALFAYGRPEYD